MSCAAGPDLSESGLVLALDGGNNKSHSSNRFISYGSGLITQDISFQVNGNGTFQRVAAGTVIGGYVVKTTDVVYSYALGSNGCHYHGNSAPIPAGSYATFSFDYLVTGATTYPITDFLANFENYGGGALSGSVATANSLQNVWQRRTFTSGPTASAGTQAMFLYPGSCGGRLADSGTIYYRNPKVEWTNVDTGDGNFSSMPNVTTWYDMSGNGNNGTLTAGQTYSSANSGSIGFAGASNQIVTVGTSDQYFYGGNLNITFESWIKSPGLAVGKTVNGIFSFSYGNILYMSSDGNITFGIYNQTANDWGYFASTSGLNLLDNQWHQVVGTMTATTGAIYTDGILRTSGAGTHTGTNVWIGMSAQIGNNQNDAYYHFNGNIAIARFYRKALTAQEIQQNFIATRSRFGI